VTRDDEGAAPRRARARARAQLERARRLGTWGLTLFVGGPVLGLGIAVGGVLLAVFGTTTDVWWWLAVPAGMVLGVVLHRIGLRLLLAAEEARPGADQVDGEAVSPARTRPDS
jgi:MFS family permease